MVADSLETVRLVLQADDFGLSPAVSDGILRGFRHGLLTSTSILANGPDFGRATDRWDELLAAQRTGRLPSHEARVALGDPQLPFDFGVHLNLTQGKPLTGRCYPGQLLDGQGRFPGIGRTFTALFLGGHPFRRAIRDELAAQIERVAASGADLVHLNGHQYMELIPLVSDLVLELANNYAIRCLRLAREPGLRRSLRASGGGPAALLLAAVKQGFSRRLTKKLATAGLVAPSAFFGTAHAGRIDLAVCHEFLRTISEIQGQDPAGECGPLLVEIAFHPGLPPEDGTPSAGGDEWFDPLARLRAQECELLTSDFLIELLLRFRVRMGRLRELAASNDWTTGTHDIN